MGGALKYTFHAKTAGGKAETVEADDVLHIPGPGFDGLRSMSQLRYGLLYPAGIASAADQQAASFMADGARPDFAIEMTAGMSKEQREEYRASWMQRHSGHGSKKAPVILTGGMKLHQLTMSMEDAQLLSTRAFQVEEICRIFGVPPHMVGHTDKTTSWGSGIEQQSMGFVTYTLQRHLVAFEQEINFKLFKTARNFAEFVTAGLLRGDTKSRNESYRIALGRAGEPAWMRPSEVRKLENLPPDPELDVVPDPPPVPAVKQETDVAMLGMLGAVTAMAAREQPTPTVNMPAINIEGARVQVDGPIVNVPETTVTLEAAITNAMPEQQAAVVNVAAPIVEVKNVMPAFETEQRIERDAIGDIARIVTTRSKT